MKKNYEAIIEKIKNKKYGEVRAEVLQLNVVNLADIIDELEPKDTIIFFRMLPKSISADVFSYLSIEQQTNIVNSITTTELKEIIEELYLDDIMTLLDEIPANMVNKILQNASADQRKLINTFLQYEEYSAGSVMTVEYMSLKKNLTVIEAIEHIRHTQMDTETIYDCFVTDESRKLEGIISLRQLVINSENAKISDIMNRNIISVKASDDQEKVAKLFKKYDLLSIPVVDNENRLLGIITIDDIMDVIDDEVTEDMEIMAAITPSEKEYLDSSIFSLAKNRFVWLLILMISATFTGSILSNYEEALKKCVTLTLFIPMLMDTGGNAGSQSATLIIRGLALGEITIKDFWKIIYKEVLISLMLGIGLAGINYIRIRYIVGIDVLMALTVSFTLVVTVLTANVVGGLLPILARKLNLDPAIMASPLITTIVDITTLWVYFEIARFLLKI